MRVYACVFGTLKQKVATTFNLIKTEDDAFAAAIR